MANAGQWWADSRQRKTILIHSVEINIFRPKFSGLCRIGTVSLQIENCLVPTNGVAMLAAMKIAFIGLGRMGVGMARNLLRAGHSVTLYNRTREKAEALAGDEARVANSPAESCREAEVVMSMLADDVAIEEIVFGN